MKQGEIFDEREFELARRYSEGFSDGYAACLSDNDMLSKTIENIISIINSTNNCYTEDCAYAFNDICYVVKEYLNKQVRE